MPIQISNSSDEIVLTTGPRLGAAGVALPAPDLVPAWPGASVVTGPTFLGASARPIWSRSRRSTPALSGPPSETRRRRL